MGKRNKILTVLKILLPALFINYFISITFFTHSHVINGVTIVHSHPYKNSGKGDPSHEHTGKEIQLIETLATFFTTFAVLWAFLFHCPFLKRNHKLYYYKSSDFIPPLRGILYLRPPPSLRFS